MKTTFPCFYHPTTLVFVDDDIDAIHNYTLSLPPYFSIQCFSVPEQALAYLNSPTRPKPLHQRCRLLVSDFNHFENELGNPRRFEETCIVIADYAMPSMNGIDLCKAITDPYIHKILLTSIADEKLAVQAFNDEIIHRFFAKQDRDTLKKLHSALLKIQNDYFCAISSQVTELIRFATPAFFNDPSFLAFFNRLIEERNIYEYYFYHQPNGFLLIDENGKLSRLIVYTPHDLRFQLDMAISKHAPPQLIAQLQSDSVDKIPYFGEPAFGIYDSAIDNWQACFYPAKTLNGQQTYYYTIIENPSINAQMKDNFIGFFDYLDTLGENA